MVSRPPPHRWTSARSQAFPRAPSSISSPGARRATWSPSPSGARVKASLSVPCPSAQSHLGVDERPRHVPILSRTPRPPQAAGARATRALGRGRQDLHRQAPAAGLPAEHGAIRSCCSRGDWAILLRSLASPGPSPRHRPPSFGCRRRSSRTRGATTRRSSPRWSRPAAARRRRGPPCPRARRFR